MDNELISRSALYDKLIYDTTKTYTVGGNAYVDILRIADAIQAAPAVDAVEVVRCGECKHIENSPYGRYCTVWHGHNGMGDEGFCNYGERKTK